ncbi:calcineurin [Kineothrix sp. MB12-C1]|uniref:calcineurin n=1 Tax=Kineothrix sp. MB12-C1 TaxID=3070215 RepID=UPI0027D24230|nr:calcineurin [Kineothrix sp. MB12-C1]WMC93915.1 calcineurin [Kineothrix sp. MB12-C1]
MCLIKGNHELFAQMYLESRLEAKQWKLWGGVGTIREIEALTDFQLKELHGFLRDLEHYKIIDFSKYKKAVLTHSGLHADYIMGLADGEIDIVRSIERAVQEDEFDYLISNDLHYVPARLIDRINMFVIVGHVPVMSINDDNSYKIVHKKKYMCMDTGSGYRKDGGKISMYRIDDNTEYYI